MWGENGHLVKTSTETTSTSHFGYLRLVSDGSWAVVLEFEGLTLLGVVLCAVNSPWKSGETVDGWKLCAHSLRNGASGRYSTKVCN